MKNLIVLTFCLMMISFAAQSLEINGYQVPQDKKAYADKIISYSSGSPSPKSKYTKKKQALGKPDFNSKKLTGFVSLGCKGSLVVQFTNNDLFDDAKGDDLFIAEVGPDIEATTVEVSTNGVNWVKVGTISGARRSLDLKGKVSANTKYTYVRLTDMGKACRGDTPGADIDAVVSLTPSFENRTLVANTNVSQAAGVINTNPCTEDRRVCDADGDSRLAIQYGGDDCDDNDPNRFPGNVEIADRNGHDEDCDPMTFGDMDEDGDGYHASWAYNLDEAGRRIGGKDCDDTKANINPRSVEACDNIDNNCNGETDEGLNFPHYADRDKDLFGNPNEVKMLCKCSQVIDGVHWVTNKSDCNDKDPQVNPSNGNCTQ